MANRVPHVEFTVVDLNAKRIAAWNSSSLPIFEPDLADVLRVPRDGVAGERMPNLTFTTRVDQAVADADIIFVSVNTPTKTHGLGAGSASDLGYLESATRKIAEVSSTNKIVVEKSTVPCRTAESVRDILAANGKPGVQFDVISNPEFLAEGTAISDLLYPDRVLIGSILDEAGARAASILTDLYAEWVPRDRIITMNLWSSELAKIAANALLAQRISSVNALSAICEATGAEIGEVSYAVGLDQRIGPKMLKSSVGFGGSCFKKDILSLVYLSESLHLPEVAAYWKSVVDINEWQKDRFTKRVIHCLYNTLVGKKVAIFGFAYKKNTGDTRESAAISIVNSLIAERSDVSIYDPEVKDEQIMQDLTVNSDHPRLVEERVTICRSAQQACVGAHAVVIVTEWDEFKTDGFVSYTTPPDTPPHSNSPAPLDSDGEVQSQRRHNKKRSVQLGTRPRTSSKSGARVNWSQIAKAMNKPAFVFDGRNVVEAAKLEKLGFRVECIGKAKSVPSR